MKTVVQSALLALTLAAPARAATPTSTSSAPKASAPRPAPAKPPPTQPPSPYLLEARVSALAGGFSGDGTRRNSGGLGILDVRLEPGLRGERSQLEVRVPLRLERTETFGGELSQTLASAFLEPSWRPARHLKLGAEGGFVRVWRLGWPDLYQPNPDLTLQHTNRYSYQAWRAGANVYGQPVRHHHLRFRWRVSSYTYTHDPNWDPGAPTHITPRDNVQNSIDASWRYLRDTYALALRLDATFRRDSVYPARHAFTGSILTPTRTPHQKLNDYEPSVELELRKLANQVTLSFSLGWAIRDDAYEGYYSYSGPHPRAVAEWAASERLSLTARVEAWWLEYGPRSRDPNRPTPNEGGTRLYDHLVRLRAEGRYRLGAGVSAVAEASWHGRDTNYPDYLPNVFPSTRQYAIDWDNDSFRAVTGLEWRM